MKNHSIVVRQRFRFVGVTACAMLTLGLTSASAQVYGMPAYSTGPATDLGFYLGGDLGLSWVPPFQTSRLGAWDSFSPREGLRLGVEPGYNFLATEKITLGCEFETGVIYNYLPTIWAAGSPTPMRGDYYQVPLLANLVLKLHPDSFVTPYVGVGAGGDATWFRVRQPGYLGDYIYYSNLSHSELDPAVQGLAGVRFRLNGFSELGLEYKILAEFPNEGRYVATHSVSATVSMRF
jgi:opacity protein-like surface antigen